MHVKKKIYIGLNLVAETVRDVHRPTHSNLGCTFGSRALGNHLEVSSSSEGVCILVQAPSVSQSFTRVFCHNFHDEKSIWIGNTETKSIVLEPCGIAGRLGNSLQRELCQLCAVRDATSA